MEVKIKLKNCTKFYLIVISYKKKKLKKRLRLFPYLKFYAQPDDGPRGGKRVVYI